MSQAFDHLLELISHLRSPDGCAWDRKQTHDTLRSHLLEETYEVLETLDQQEPNSLKEELGDLLLQVLLHAHIEEEEGHFSMNDVVIHLSEKLIRRHPHVFNKDPHAGESLSATDVVQQWEVIKQAERVQVGQRDSILQGVPKSLPSLHRAHQVQSRASRVGFDWEQPRQVVEKLNEELEELRMAISDQQSSQGTSDSQVHPSPNIEAEFGDVLFTVANMARFLHLNPEEALRKSTNRFVSRFQFMERQAEQSEKNLQELTDQEWDSLWEQAKSYEQNQLNPGM